MRSLWDKVAKRFSQPKTSRQRGERKNEPLKGKYADMHLMKVEDVNRFNFIENESTEMVDP